MKEFAHGERTSQDKGVGSGGLLARKDAGSKTASRGQALLKQIAAIEHRIIMREFNAWLHQPSPFQRKHAL